MPFDPLRDESLPDGAGALVLAGGFPEVFGAELEANAALRAARPRLRRRGRPVLAECGGLLYLCAELDGHAMCGVLPARGRMAGRLTLGYREADAATVDAVARRGRARARPRVPLLRRRADRPRGAPAWWLTARGSTRDEGLVAGAVQASYLHVHWAAHRELAHRFARAAAARPVAA